MAIDCAVHRCKCRSGKPSCRSSLGSFCPAPRNASRQLPCKLLCPRLLPSCWCCDAACLGSCSRLCTACNRACSTAHIFLQTECGTNTAMVQHRLSVGASMHSSLHCPPPPHTPKDSFHLANDCTLTGVAQMGWQAHPSRQIWAKGHGGWLPGPTEQGGASQSTIALQGPASASATAPWGTPVEGRRVGGQDFVKSGALED